MPKVTEKIGNAIFLVIFALCFPIISIGANNLAWNLGFIAMLATTVLLGVIQTQWHTAWVASIAAVVAIVAASAHWLLLPLLLAQVGLAVIVATQPLTTGVRATGLLLIGAFVQVALMLNQNSILTTPFLYDLLFQLLPFIFIALGDKLPLVARGVGLLIIIVAAYVLQRYTIVAALACIILGLVPAFLKKVPVAAYPLAATVLGIIMHLSMMRG
ncbi:hypothetical protein PQ472_08945 [Lacticaseibacillus pabuli]|uniref:Electron transport complex protein RnfD n=1 Tax=Lacticaseibacillus pabuli TaxID=3025672 RepID=A0ABY7WVV0_9LACO|nr:hypothetical protein [Lacticaseibacillus sp. KACC 23028]WDF82045.1 hypothetical protein PQ472_08945 [Lacticaseibacillus sp. KACC 23028]